MVQACGARREVKPAISLLPLLAKAHLSRLDLVQKQGRDRVLAASNWRDQGIF